MVKVNLSENILPHFKQLFKDIINNKYFRVVVKGGRSSAKSVFVAIAIIVGVMTHKRSAIALVRTKVDVAKRLDNVFIKALTFLGLRDYFRYVETKHTFILLDAEGNDTDVAIYCTGADDPERLKGITPKSGSFLYLWIEEATNFANIKAIKNLESSMGRGDILHFTSIISYNPKQNTSHFLNQEFENIKDTDEMVSLEEDEETGTKTRVTNTVIDDDLVLQQCVFHCTYKGLIKHGHRDWISPTDLVDIKHGEANNTEYYRWYYLGEVCGQDSVNVFRNIKDWDGDLDKLNITSIDRGLDCSNGGPDPWSYGEWYFDKANRNLYCLSEFYLGGEATIEDIATNIKRINKLNQNFYIDSAVPTFRRMLEKQGVHPLPAKKGKDSVRAGILWLQSLNGIYFCERLTPRHRKEFMEYEFITDKYDEVTTELPDKNNHGIDECRYANSIHIKYE